MFNLFDVLFISALPEHLLAFILLQMIEPTELSPTLEEALKPLEICLLCRHRLLFGSSFHCHGLPKYLREGTKLTHDEITKCVLCFGLCGLFLSTSSESDVLSQIMAKVRQSGFDFSTFQLNVRYLRGSRCTLWTFV